MYHKFFGLEEQAFSIAVNPRYLFLSDQHKEALAHLMYGVKSGGFVMLTGEVGTGKTTTVRCLLEQLPESAEVAMVLNPAASAVDLLCNICDELDIYYKSDESNIKVLTDKLQAYLLANHSAGKSTIVLIDEAQLLKVSTLEQLRLLTNLESNTRKLLQIILVGQPELNELLARPALRQLSQRITARYHLRPLDPQETMKYIRHRLRVAGLPPGRQLFPDSVINRIFHISKGVPRVFNILCDRMLLGAYTDESNTVDMAIMQRAAVEVMGHQYKGSVRDFNWRESLIYGAGAFALVLLVVWIYLLWPAKRAPVVNDALAQAPSTVQIDAPIEPVVERQLPAKSAVSEPMRAASAPDSFFFSSRDDALFELFAALELDWREQGRACWAASRNGYQCQTQKAGSWEAFLAVNRPAVISQVDDSKFSSYATLIGVSGKNGIIRRGGSLELTPLETLGKNWTGEYTFIWQKPEGFRKAIGLGSKGEVVSWVAKAFARLDDQGKPLASTAFNKALQSRVKVFQRNHGLADDGFVGMQTLLRLNEAIGADISLQALSKRLEQAKVES